MASIIKLGQSQELECATAAFSIVLVGAATTTPLKAGIEHAFKKRKLLEMSTEDGGEQGLTNISLEGTLGSDQDALQADAPAPEILTSPARRQAHHEDKLTYSQLDDGYRYLQSFPENLEVIQERHRY